MKSVPNGRGKRTQLRIRGILPEPPRLVTSIAPTLRNLCGDPGKRYIQRSG